MLIATFAVSFLLQNVYLLAFGSRGSTVGTLGGLNTAIALGSLRIRWITIVAAIAALVLLGALTLLLNRTMIGLQLRAAAADLRTARTLGVRANRVIMAAFAISGMLAAAVAVLLTVSVAARHARLRRLGDDLRARRGGGRRPRPARDGVARRLRDRLRERVRRRPAAVRVEPVPARPSSTAS